MKFTTSATGAVEKLIFGNTEVPMSGERPTAITVREGGCDREISLKPARSHFYGTRRGVSFFLYYKAGRDRFSITVEVRNRTKEPFAPEALKLRLGIDTYLAEYPAWNRQFFPTLLRPEATHFYGYFMTPAGQMLGIGCDAPIPAYSYEFNLHTEGFGHRIYTTDLHLMEQAPLPERLPQIRQIAPGEVFRRTVVLFPVRSPEVFEKRVSDVLGVPVLAAKRTAVARGEELTVKLFSPGACHLTVTAPDGTVHEGDRILATAEGEYRFTATDENGKRAELRAVCHRPFAATLDMARDAAFRYPQKATTHAESYYGFYSAFLAAKHFPKPDLDRRLREHFDEVIPYMFDLKRGEPRLIPERIQNTATLIGELADLYEANPAKNRDALQVAGLFADFIMRQQGEDGAYRRGGCGTHYTCVIYIAKSMLELALAERAAGGKFKKAAELHYESVRRAVDDLVLHLEDIGTEGEHTLEDGMIACSALQIGMFALTLPKKEQAPYIRAAEHMLEAHACLDNLHVPDYRMRGGTLRFWEAQYDVMFMSNFMNTPHGWSAWCAYATYYLYILTGKEEYLTRTYNAMGAGTSLLGADGTLSWAFCADPVVTAEHIVPDTDKPVTDAYRNVPDTPAYRAKWETATIGECAVPMISDWFRTGKDQPVTGGYMTCPLILPEGRREVVDVQGGACDNDVHEIFKCLEETLMNKVFLLGDSHGNLTTYGAPLSAGDIPSLTMPEGWVLHVNLKKPLTLSLNGAYVTLKSGRYFYHP